MAATSDHTITAEIVPSFVACSSYNVVLIGDSRVGKSTFIELLQQPIIETGFGLYRGTELPQVKTLFLSLKVNGQDKHIVLNILDTPGLNEKPEKGVPRHDDELKDLISEHIKSHFSELDLILITLKCSGITQGVIDTIFQIKDYFGNKYLDNMCLLFTNCDSMTSKDEDDFKAALDKNPVINQFLTAIKYRLIFTGRNAEHPSSTSDVDFVTEQTRRKKVFLHHLTSSAKINLKKSTVLSDLRPIDVLESASVTNSIILYQGQLNKQEFGLIGRLIVQLQSLSLDEENSKKRDALTEHLSKRLAEVTLVDSTDDEKAMAQKYTDSEIPLKVKAQELRLQSHYLKQQLISVRSALEVFSLKTIKAIVSPTIEKEQALDLTSFF